MFYSYASLYDLKKARRKIMLNVKNKKKAPKMVCVKAPGGYSLLTIQCKYWYKIKVADVLFACLKQVCVWNFFKTFPTWCTCTSQCQAGSKERAFEWSLLHTERVLAFTYSWHLPVAVGIREKQRESQCRPAISLQILQPTCGRV